MTNSKQRNQRRQRNQNNEKRQIVTAQTTMTRKTVKPKGQMRPGGLSMCSRDYARSLANPFTGPAACIPSYPALLTRKMRVWSKGVMNTSSTTGFGFVTLCPQNGAASDLRMVEYTTSAYNDTVIGNDQAGAIAGQVQASSNSEYLAASFGNEGLRVRVVSAGLRIRYIGTELNRGGQLIGFHDPEHDTAVGQGITQFDGETESVRFAVDRTWKTVLYRPVTDADNELRYDQFAGPNLAYTAPGTWYMTFLAQAAVATTPEPFEWEAYVNYEISGRNVRGKTPSHFDPTGFSAVHSSTVQTAELLPSSRTDQQREQSFLQTATRYLNDAVSFGTTLYRTVETAAEAAAPLLALL